MLMYNVCAVPWGVQYHEGYQDACGEISWVLLEIFSTLGDIMINVGIAWVPWECRVVILSTVGGCSVLWGISWVPWGLFGENLLFEYLMEQYSNYKGWYSPTILNTLKMVFKMAPMCIMIFLSVPHCIQDSPHGTHDIPHGTEHLLRYSSYPPRYSRYPPHT